MLTTKAVPTWPLCLNEVISSSRWYTTCFLEYTVPLQTDFRVKKLNEALIFFLVPFCCGGEGNGGRIFIGSLLGTRLSRNETKRAFIAEI